MVALVTEGDGDGNAVLTLRNKITAGESLEVVGPDCKPETFTAEGMTDMDGTPLEMLRNPQMMFRMKLPRAVPAWSILRAARDLSAKS